MNDHRWEPRTAATPEGAYVVFPVGSRVMTKEGFPGTVDDVHEAPADLTTYFVTLDGGMGGGQYAEAELQPLSQVSAAQASTERTAADDYPELGTILHDRLPPEIHKIEDGSASHGIPNLSMWGSKTAAAWNEKNDCTCCDGVGEHDCGHECYVCDASGNYTAQHETSSGAYDASGEPVCPGHHGTDDHERGADYAGPGLTHESSVTAEQWLINGKPYSDGVWIEVEPDTWYRGAARPDEIPSRLVVRREGDKWRWEAQVLTYIGAPHENKNPKGQAKTLEQAQERALASIAKDHEFFQRYDERQRAKLQQVAAEDAPEVSGVVLKARDTGRVLMLQRGLDDDTDDNAGKWEFPGGHHEEGDRTSLDAGIREWEEEVGYPFPEGGVVEHVWRSPNGVYQGHVVVIDSEKQVDFSKAREISNPDDPSGDGHEQAAWWDVEDARKNPALRGECKRSPWDEIKKASVKTAQARTIEPPTTSRTASFDDDALAEFPSHSLGCRSQALQSAAENGATPEQEELWAAIYLKDGTQTCTCGVVPEQSAFGSKAASMQQIIDSYISTADLIRLATTMYDKAMSKPVWQVNGYPSAQAMRDYYEEQGEDARMLAAEALDEAGLTLRDLGHRLSSKTADVWDPKAHSQGCRALETDDWRDCNCDWAKHSLSTTAEAGDLYLPPGDPAERQTNPKGDTPEEQQGWKDGHHDALHGAERRPKSDEPLYRAGYNMGWAAAVEAEHAQPDLTGMNPEEPIIQSVSGLWDFVVGNPEPSGNYRGIGNDPSYDWCRFRKRSHCYFPRELNEHATKVEGYAVFVPEDRGMCPRIKWADQQQCPVGEPGPNVPGGYLDATVPYEQGGQRGGVPGRQYRGAREGLDWHFTAAWKDVREKAKKIRSEGRVRILNSANGQVVAQVQGDEHAYQTVLTRVPGKQAVGYWECACPWAAYSWGRSGRWKRYEGRMCSHALAVQYEAQSRGMFGKEVTVDTQTPEWASEVKVPGDYDRDKQKFTSRRRPVVAQEDASIPLVDLTVQAKSTTFPAQVRGRVQDVEIDDDGNLALVNGHQPLRPQEVLYPTYDPNLGLNPRDRRRASLALEAAMDDEWATLLPGDPEPGMNAPTFAWAGPNSSFSASEWEEQRFREHMGDDPPPPEDPEPALPETYGDEELDAAAARIEAALSTQGSNWINFDNPGAIASHTRCSQHILNGVRLKEASPGNPCEVCGATSWAGSKAAAYYTEQEMREQGQQAAAEQGMTAGEALAAHIVAQETTFGLDMHDTAQAVIDMLGLHNLTTAEDLVARAEAGPQPHPQFPIEPIEGDGYVTEGSQRLAEEDNPFAWVPDAMMGHQPSQREADLDLTDPHGRHWHLPDAVAEPPRTDTETMAMGLGDDTTEAREDLGLPPLDEGSVDDVLAAHQARLAALAEGEQVEGPDPFAHLLGGQGSPDVAAAAREFLAKEGMDKTALKDFSPAERQQIINEGVNASAANLDRLDITGTHYEALEQVKERQEDQSDTDWMWSL